MTETRARAIGATWWMRIVGAFYLVQFTGMVLLRAPIRVQGPDGALALADAGDPLARFLVDTWVTFGLEVGAIGLAVLIASRAAHEARALMWAVIGIEVARGITADIYMILRGQEPAPLLVWIAIHTVVIATGLLAVRSARRAAYWQRESHSDR